MYTLIKIYLLLKSLFGREFTLTDIALAAALEDYPNTPSWLVMIAFMKEPAKLPEAWRDFVWSLWHGGAK
jgi:hypothetical protein